MRPAVGSVVSSVYSKNISNVAGRAANPYGAILAGACVLAAPAVILFMAFQKHFTATDIGSGVKG